MHTERLLTDETLFSRFSKMSGLSQRYKILYITKIHEEPCLLKIIKSIQLNPSIFVMCSPQSQIVKVQILLEQLRFYRMDHDEFPVTLMSVAYDKSEQEAL